MKREAKNTNTTITTKEANKKIENEVKLTKEEIQQLQKDASEKRHETLKMLESQVKDIQMKITSRNNARVKISESSVEVCYKQNNLSLYVNTKCKDEKEMLKLHKTYTEKHKSKFEAVTKIQNNKDFRDSNDFKNKHRIRIKIDSVASDRKAYDEMLKAVKEIEAYTQEIAKMRKAK